MQEKNGSYTVLQRLLPRHQTIKKLSLSGLNPPQIADKLGMTSRQVYNIINSPTFQHELSLLQDQAETQTLETLQQQVDTVSSIIANQTKRAAEKLGLLLESEDESIALRTAQDILDRGGYPRTTSSQNSSSTTITIDEKQAIIIAESLSMLSPQKNPLETLTIVGSPVSDPGTSTPEDFLDSPDPQTIDQCLPKKDGCEVSGANEPL